jgi:hypothetical protein
MNQKPNEKQKIRVILQFLTLSDFVDAPATNLAPSVGAVERET